MSLPRLFLSSIRSSVGERVSSNHMETDTPAPTSPNMPCQSLFVSSRSPSAQGTTSRTRCRSRPRALIRTRFPAATPSTGPAVTPTCLSHARIGRACLKVGPGCEHESPVRASKLTARLSVGAHVSQTIPPTFSGRVTVLSLHPWLQAQRSWVTTSGEAFSAADGFHLGFLECATCASTFVEHRWVVLGGWEEPT